VSSEVLEAGRELVVVGRAGVGLDNVDVAAATRLGVVVVNAPESNVVSAAEHTMALILSLARHVPQAHAALVAGRWERSRWEGTELDGKTLGIVGLGRVGALVARLAQGFGMRTVAHDPYTSAERARVMGVELMALEKLAAEADFLTVHLPKTQETVGLVGKELLDKAKPGLRVINTARGGSESVRSYLGLVERLGRCAASLSDGLPGRLDVTYAGALASEETGILTLALLKGVFAAGTEEPVSYVNAPRLAEERGLEVVESTTATSPEYVSLVTVRSSAHSIAGTLSAGGRSPGAKVERIVMIDDHIVDVPFAPNLLVVRNDDRPGMVGLVGTALGEAGLSIQSMAVGQSPAAATALMALSTDHPVPDELLGRLRSCEGILAVHRLLSDG
jgi:L-serine deaminase